MPFEHLFGNVGRVTSLRFGPTPADLPLADPSGREFRTSRTTADFAIVRFRHGGRWTLGVLRGWRRSAAGTIVRIESLEPASKGAEALWFEFRPESVDPLQIEERTGEIRIVPPSERGAVAG
jgi:hypothetical protein